MQSSQIRALVLVIALPLCTVSALAAAEGALDGRSFHGTTAARGQETGEADTLVFADGTFRSLGCDEYGFAAAPYSAEEEDGTIHFEAEAVSETEGTISWQGVVTGDAVRATFLWTKEGQEPIEYLFEGEEAD